MGGRVTSSAGAGGARRAHQAEPLTTDRILDTAMGIVEDEGADALTLRRLGAVLGVNHTAVLRHFAGKDAILLGLCGRLMEEALDGFEPAEDWRETLIGLGHRTRQACLRHPSVAILVSARVSRTEAEFRGADTVIAALLQAGFEGREAALLYRAATDLALAMASYEAAFNSVEAEALRGDRLAWRREYLLASPVRYPHLASVAAYLGEITDDEVFETALGFVIDSLAARAAERQTP